MGEFRIRVNGNEWHEVAIHDKPLFLREGGKWVIFAEGPGGPLSLRHDNTWSQISTEGRSSGIIFGRLTESGTIGLPHKRVSIRDIQSSSIQRATVTDDEGYFSFKDVPFNLQFVVFGFRVFNSDNISDLDVVTDPDEVAVEVNFSFDRGEYAFRFRG